MKIREEKQKEAYETVAWYTAEIKEKGKEIERLGSERGEIKKRLEDSVPEPMYEMNTALMCFIIALLALRDNIHAYFRKEFLANLLLK